MKRIKLLLPTIFTTAITPVIVTSCGGKSVEEKIMDAIIDPTKLAQDTKVTDFTASLKALNDEDRQKEVIYDLFGLCNLTTMSDKFTFEKSLTDMWQDETVTFATNITKCSLNIDADNNITSSFLGYVSFIFNKDVKCNFGSQEITFKNKDFIMLTYDFLNAKVTIDDDGTFKYSQKLPESVMGFYKVKYNGSNEEFMLDIPNPNTYTYKNNVRNSHRWIKEA